MSKEQDYINVQQLHQEGYSIRQIAEKTGISKSSVGRMVKQVQSSGLGTATGTRPTFEAGTVAGAVPAANWDSNKEAAPRVQSGDQDNKAFWEAMMLNSRIQRLENLYSMFLDFTDTFLTREVSSEKLLLSYSKEEQEKVKEFIMEAKGICSDCHVHYDGLFMAYVLEQLYFFLGQPPELEKTYWGFKIKARAVLVPYLRQAKRIDVFTPIEHGIGPFPVRGTW